ncbi:MAG: tetratricopeptide repeat protein [Deltaproteobacteria bacterium]|nr:tetratricopeptide repeat protein [Deltaproteobacteria bacterium]
MGRTMVVAFLSALALHSTAFAAKPKPKKPAPARVEKKPATTPGKDEFEKGTRYFEAEEYEAALPFFQKAYELSGKRPATIFSLAQCERSLKRYDDAITHFKEYLATTPRPPDAAEVETTLALLIDLARDQKLKEEQEQKLEEEEERKKREEAERAARPPPALPPPAPPPPEEDSLLTSPVFLGVAGAVIIAGGVLALVATSGEEEPYGGNTRVILGK